MNKNEAIAMWQELQSLNWTPAMITDINLAWETRVLALHKELLGKRKSNFDLAFRNLKENDYEDLLTNEMLPFREEVDKRYKEFKANKENLEEQLKEFAKTYSPEKTSDLQYIKTSQSYSYSSQPSHNKYAREALNENIKLLELLGFSTDVKTVNEHTSKGMYPSYWEDYELWANISPFDFYMLEASGEFVSVLNWAVLCWKKGTNPKVYFQFLSQDDYDKSQVLAYECNYEITKDNMKLELSWDEINRLKRK